MTDRRRDIERRPLGLIRDEYKQREIDKWATYGKCEKCGALPKNPCKERAHTGNNQTINKPHHGRPQQDQP